MWNNTVVHNAAAANKAANDENKSVDARRQFIIWEEIVWQTVGANQSPISGTARRANDCWKSSNSVSTIIMLQKSQDVYLGIKSIEIGQWRCQLSSPTETGSRDAETGILRILRREYWDENIETRILRREYWDSPLALLVNSFAAFHRPLSPLVSLSLSLSRCPNIERQPFHV